MKYSKEDIANATKRLTEWLKPGDTVYTDVKRVSSSGMSRHISCYIVRKGEIYDITYYVGVLLGERRSSVSGKSVRQTTISTITIVAAIRSRVKSTKVAEGMPLINSGCNCQTSKLNYSKQRRITQ